MPTQGEFLKHDSLYSLTESFQESDLDNIRK